MGRSHALMLASRGARVVVNDLPAGAGAGDSAGEVVAEIRANGGTAVADHHSVVGEADGIVASAIDAFGQLDIVVCYSSGANCRRAAFRPSFHRRDVRQELAAADPQIRHAMNSSTGGLELKTTTGRAGASFGSKYRCMTLGGVFRFFGKNDL
jgi:NAD(P)-dependent dehydrogenase (short-subunit alcohol dehydrogenase family)